MLAAGDSGNATTNNNAVAASDPNAAGNTTAINSVPTNCY